MTTATHPVAPEEVMALLDGELSSEKAQTVSVHLENCESCTTLAAEMRGISESLSLWQVVPSGLAPKDLHAETTAGLRTGAWLSVPARWALLAAVGVVLLAVMFSMQGRRQASVGHARVASKLVREISPEAAAKAQGQTSYGAVTLSEPEVVADSNGLMHGRGDHLEQSFSINGQLNGDMDQRLSTAVSAPMVARTVSLSLIVKDFAASRANLDVILHRHHGYAANLTANTAENTPRSIEASLRVPASELDAAVADLKALGKVEKEFQSGEEVTQQHADLLARLKNSRETEQRLQAILEQRTGKVKDVLEVEQEIARVRGEIEQMEAEQKSLEHRVDFATVNLSLAEEYKAQLVPPAISAATRLHNALVEGYLSATETLVSIVLFFAEYTLTLLIWGMILVLPVILLWRRYRRSLAATL
jgi:flagellar motility protein MotE (MotC chaperone)